MNKKAAKIFLAIVAVGAAIGIGTWWKDRSDGIAFREYRHEQHLRYMENHRQQQAELNAELNAMDKASEAENRHNELLDAIQEVRDAQWDAGE
jgi:hypothetical protein